MTIALAPNPRALTDLQRLFRGVSLLLDGDVDLIRPMSTCACEENGVRADQHMIADDRVVHVRASAYPYVVSELGARILESDAVVEDGVAADAREYPGVDGLA